MMIGNIRKMIFAAAAASLMTTFSCNKDMYDEEEYKKYVDFVSPVDKVDSTHTWKLATVHSLQVTANTQSGTQSLIILSSDPRSKDADVLARVYMTDGQTANLSFSAPTLNQQFYAALLNADGTYRLKSFMAGQTVIDFTDAIEPVNLYTKLTPQTYTYCFDESFPLPDDYDFNDLVLRISLERTGQKQMSVGVTLAAVGGEKQIAAAIRLVGYEYTDIESITVADGDKPFNDDIPSQSYDIMGSRDLLVGGRNREALLNLFDDAHWAMGDRLSTSYGIFKRKRYNVSSGTGDDYQMMAPHTVTYLVNFKDGSKLNDFTFASIDPFIIDDYNGAFWETHTYEHMMAKVKYEYQASNIKNLPWALEIPNGTFRYPLEGRNMGFIKDGVTFGAYMTTGYSFGEWAEDHTKSADWYFYPTGNMVY